jgi:hypothetical protein
MAEPTREELEAELARLNATLGDGVVRVQSGDRSKQYDLTEMRRRRDEIRSDLGRLRAGRMVRQVRTFSTKGL